MLNDVYEEALTDVGDIEQFGKALDFITQLEEKMMGLSWNINVEIVVVLKSSPADGVVDYSMQSLTNQAASSSFSCRTHSPFLYKTPSFPLTW